jgi:hypothetical protein
MTLRLRGEIRKPLAARDSGGPMTRPVVFPMADLLRWLDHFAVPPRKVRSWSKRAERRAARRAAERQEKAGTR